MLYKGYRIIKTKIQRVPHKHPSKIINGLVPFPPNPEKDISLGSLGRYYKPNRAMRTTQPLRPSAPPNAAATEERWWPLK